METENKRKWYHSGFGAVLFLILFFPVGVYLMWRYTHWNKLVRLGITIFFIFLTTTLFSPPKSDKEPSTKLATQPSQEIAKPTNVPTETPKPVEKMKIDVTSQIVKKVDGKYRYFFDIRNNDTKDFEGSVTITLFNNLYATPLGSGTFDTSKPMEPKLGTSVHFDINTGPVSEHGETGITKFKFIVNKNKQQINDGEGLVSSKYEDLDSY